MGAAVAAEPNEPNEPKWRRRKEERPGEIVAAALESFAANGFANTRLEDVAARAGVSKGTVYLYFSGKEELFKAVIRETLLPNLAFAEEQLTHAEGTAVELLEQFLRRIAHLMTQTSLGAIPKLILTEVANFPDLAKFYAEEVGLRAMRMFGALLERGVAEHELRRFDPVLMAPAIMAPVLMLSLWRNNLEPHVDSKIDPEAFIDMYLDVLLNGLREKGE